MNEGPEYIANELRNPAWKDHCLPAAVELMQQAAVALEERTEERDALLADLRKCEQQFADECATSSDLEKLHELATLDYEQERTENEQLRKALNQIAMSPFSSEAAKGIAAVALQIPRGENAAADPAVVEFPEIQPADLESNARLMNTPLDRANLEVGQERPGDCQLNSGPFFQCCCNCAHHWQDNHHCTTSPELREQKGGCVCGERKGWICVLGRFMGDGSTRVYSGWPEHSVGCECYTPVMDVPRPPWAACCSESENCRRNNADVVAEGPDPLA